MLGCWHAEKRSRYRHATLVPYWRASHAREKLADVKRGVDASAKFETAAAEWALLEARRSPLCTPGWREACKMVGKRDLLKRASAPVRFGKYAGVAAGTVVAERPEYLRWCCGLIAPQGGCVELLEIGTDVVRAQIAYERVIQELLVRRARLRRLRKCFRAVILSMRLWRLVEARARLKFEDERAECVLASTRLFSWVVDSEVTR